MSWYDRDYAREEDVGRPANVLSRPSGGPSLVTILIVVNVAIFLFTAYTSIGRYVWSVGAMRVAGADAVTRRILAAARMPSDALAAGGVLDGQIWRLFTSQYLHAVPGYGHILFNMLSLHFLGRPLEALWGRKKFFAIYTLSGLFGNLALIGLAMFVPRMLAVPAVGASGCLLGLLGAAAVLFPSATIYVYMLFPVKIRTAALVLAAVYALNIFKQGKNFGGDACHLAGLAFGAWWAWAGDAWWSRRRDFGAMRRTRVGGFHERVRQRGDDARLIDQILDKVHDQGIHSLSPAERRALAEATERQRDDDARLGRLDRL